MHSSIKSFSFNRSLSNELNLEKIFIFFNSGKIIKIKSKLNLFQPPTAYQAAYQQATGTRFGADAIYQGENRGFGAILSYYVKIDSKEKEETQENR